MRLDHLRCIIFGHAWALYIAFAAPRRRHRILAEQPTRTCLRCGREEIAS